MIILSFTHFHFKTEVEFIRPVPFLKPLENFWLCFIAINVLFQSFICYLSDAGITYREWAPGAKVCLFLLVFR